MEIIIPQLIVGVSIAIAASLLGVFAILKRMSLVGDALSHVALPGIALALFFKINPFIGALSFLLIAAVGIWFVEYRSQLSIDTIVGVFFTASLALGAIFIPEFELLEALFGDISQVSGFDVILSVIFSAFLIAVLIAVHKKLALHMVSQEMAYSVGVRPKTLEFIYLMLFALGVALGIRFVGALLMGALIIIPAAAAKNVARSLHGFMILSSLFGAVSAVSGIYLAQIFNSTPGPIFILVGSAIFIISIGWRILARR